MVKFIIHPTQKHLADIKNWLIEEHNTSNSGFYCNWSIIAQGFSEKNLSVITENGLAIGFVVYSFYDFQAIIDIAEIKPTERKKGYAKILIGGILEHFRSTGYLVCRLFCSPEDSQPFWKKIGFKNFPDMPHDKKINMFLPLIDTLQPKRTAETNTKISLYDCEPHLASQCTAKWHWDLYFCPDNETLTKPIIFPVWYDWQIELIKNGKKMICEKIKRFPPNIAGSGTFALIQKVTVSD